MSLRRLTSILLGAGFLAWVFGLPGPAGWLGAGASGAGAAPSSGDPVHLGAAPLSAQAAPDSVTRLDPEELATIRIFQSSSPSVAYITSIAYRRSVFSLNVQQIPRGTGSGIVWDDLGHVLTNFHVIQGSSIAR